MIDNRQYGPLSRALHHFAFNPKFGGIQTQRRLSELEESLFARDIAAAAYVDQPVFVAGLPRAGTTLILTLLAQLPEFAAHTYRDMPFVMAPLLWSRLSGPFQQTSESRERAHGDGMSVGYDSPEAFEEVIWKAFWPGKFQPSFIEPWQADDRQPEFETFLRHHAEKLVAARARDARRTATPPPKRYLSKNNANIARLDLLPVIFPNCRIVIPIRAPEDQIRSLMRQHERFSDLHARDAFARQYMSWIGHHEFGGDLRPIRFDRERQSIHSVENPGEAFWTDQWLRAHREILKPSPHKILLDFEELRHDPWGSLTRLAQALELADPQALVAGADQVKAPDLNRPKSPRTAEVETLYAQARALCINAPGRGRHDLRAAE